MIVDMKNIPKLRIDEAATAAWWVFDDGREEAATRDVLRGSMRFPRATRIVDVWNTPVLTPTGAQITTVVSSGTPSSWACGVRETAQRWFTTAYDVDMEVVP